MKLNISAEGIKFIQTFEGFLPEAVLDGNHYSIGWGHNGPDVKPGQKITKAKATVLFTKDLEWVEDVIDNEVKVPLLQHEYDALASLIYNIGGPQFQESQLLKRLNAGDRIPAAAHFTRFNKFKGSVKAGLVRRRAAEKALFLGLSHTQALKKGDEEYGIYNQRVQASRAR